MSLENAGKQADKDSERSEKSAIPSITLPRGGGAIRGIGEKFAANPVTGTGSLSVPIATSPGRSGFGPQLSLSYDSGAGNGPFGLGWNLSLPQITRKTDKGLPQYFNDEEPDVFILSGAEDLVPVLSPDSTGQWVPEVVPLRTVNHTVYRIERYRPRIEGLFARIERWTGQSDPSYSFWRTISRDNITTWYGRTSNSRICDPLDPTRIFSWLICQSYDDKGNVIVYRYKQENSENVDVSQVHERNRTPDSRRANRYLKRIYYGNREPYLPVLTTGEWPQPPDWNPSGGAPAYCFEVVFDYGDGHYSEEVPDAAGRILARPVCSPPISAKWPARDDPFSTYRAGFEVRSYRRCRRVLMFHHFPNELGTPDYLVRSTDFTYSSENNPADASNPIYSFLDSVGQSGYKRQANGDYLKKSLPPLEFEYSRPIVQDAVQDVDPASLENLPFGLDGAAWQWTDLHGEGIPGLLSEQSGAWFYKRNISPISELPVEFARLECVAEKPNQVLAGGQAQFLDLAGNGKPDLVVLDGPTPGFYEHDGREGWGPFRPFSARLNRNMRDPNLRFVDLDGDGHADVLITEDEAFVWHASLAGEGFGPARRAGQALDEEKGPRLVFADGTQTIYLADLSGDGLTDLVRIRNGDVCYWPNLGYCRFGAKITMDNSPWFDHPDQFDHKRIRLADIDGSGTTDVIYLHRDGVRLYFNRSGNSWSEPEQLQVFPRVDDVASIVSTDLLGNGTACLVWSSSLPGNACRPMRYVNLMGDLKPHLLIGVTNNLGARTRIEYAPSTRFYLQDKQAGKPWVTKLPFPVHVVTKVTVSDEWRKTTFSSSYSYHHGYFDGVEREFRGFGRVEQTDVENYGRFEQGNAASPYITDNHELYQPPIKTITWYHTGTAFERDHILSIFQNEYFDIPGFAEHRLPDPLTAPGTLSPDEWREAVRACKGMLLRREVFELDVDALSRGKELPVRLYNTASYNSDVRKLQPQSLNRHAVFLVTESEAMTCHYELDLRSATLKPDPRIVHTLNLRFDDYGRALQTVAVVYPRLIPHEDPAGLLKPGQLGLIRKVQSERHLAYTETRFTEEQAADPDRHRLPAPCEVITCELTGDDSTHGFAAGAGGYFTLIDLRAFRLSETLPHQGTKPVTKIDYHRQPGSQSAHKRVVERVCMLYFKEDLSGPEPFGTHAWHGLPYETYRLALTRDLLGQVFGTRLTSDVFAALNSPAISGYTSGTLFSSSSSDQWWIGSGSAGFAPDAAEHFYLPEHYTDPFGSRTTISYDGAYDLFIQSSSDALGNTTRVEQFDYRVLAPCEMVDINGNHSEVYFDVLGMVTALAVKGKGNEGDDLTGFDDDSANPPAIDVQAFCTDSVLDMQKAREWSGNATSRFVYHFGEKRDSQGRLVSWADRPPGACGIVREIHLHAPGGAASPLQVTLECSDGSGSVLMKKMQAEPDPDSGATRWIVNGRTIFNNKGKPVKQYEPAFTTDFGCECPQASGVSTTTCYDAAGRVVRVEMPDGSFSRVEFSPWHVMSFDRNDTILEPGSSWYAEHSAATARDEDKRAAALTLQHAGTPAQVHLDSLGREVIAIAHNRTTDAGGQWQDELHLTFTRLDAEGKPLWIRDARGNLVMQYITPTKINSDPGDDMPSGSVPCYDIAGNLLFQHSMDGGDRWMLMDAAGKLMLAWDINQRQLPDNSFADQQRLYSVSYDSLQRPVARRLKINSEAPVMVERFEYQDALLNDTGNLNGQLVQHYDSGGCIETIRRDFKGNLCEVRRRLNNSPAESVIDWQSSPESRLETEAYTQITEFDALNRMTRHFNWHRGEGGRVAVYLPVYNQRGLLKRERLITRAGKMKLPDGRDDYVVVTDVTMPKAVQGTRNHETIEEIRYNAKGQKEFVKLGNGTLTQYDYDAQTFRLRQTRTTRSADATDFPRRRSNLTDSNIVQQLLYTYDPVGNIVEIEDQAYEPVFFKNQMVEPRNRYVYDALYRLIEASGREGFNPPNAPVQREADPQASVTFPLTNQTLRNYTQRYTYDAVGNILRMRHIAAQGNWHRRYAYATDSNRLLKTWEGHDDWNNSRASRKTEYNYDTHGSMRNTANVAPGQYLRWNYSDMLENLDLQGGGRAHYQYDSGKQRTRKRIVRNSGSVEERIYLGGFELYRRYTPNSNVPVEEIESHHLIEGEQRLLLVEDVIRTNRRHADYRSFKAEPILRYQYSNHLGSACLELDHQADIISYEEYHPYGTSAYRTVKSGIEAPAMRYRYTGMERDEESGLSYHTARYYLPWLGRWGSCDPSGMEGGINLFVYGSSNPIQLLDRNGYQADEPGVDKEKFWKAQFNFVKAVEQNFIDERLPTTAREKSVDVDIATEAHDQAVVNIINAAILAAGDRAKATGKDVSEYELLTSALFDYVTPYRSGSPERSQNLVLRDVDHYLTGRIQKWRSFLPWEQHDISPGPTQNPLIVELGNLAAEKYDDDKRYSFASKANQDESNAKSSLDENSKPASAPGGRFWAWLGGQHLLTRDNPEQTANPFSLVISYQDVKGARLIGAASNVAYHTAYEVLKQQVNMFWDTPGQWLKQFQTVKGVFDMFPESSKKWLRDTHKLARQFKDLIF